MVKPMFSRGQSAIEYLLLLGAAILIAAVVVALISFVGSGGKTSAQESGVQQRLAMQNLAAVGGMGFSYSCVANGVCEADETMQSCSADCAGKPFRQYLHFYSAEAGGSEVSSVPAPMLNVPASGLRHYIYVELSEMHGHLSVYRSATVNNANNRSVALSPGEIDALFNLYGVETGNPVRGKSMNMSILQRADVQKIHHELAQGNPAYNAKYGNGGLETGVGLDGSGMPVLDASDKLVPDRPVQDYQDGKTMLWPFYYNASGKHKMRVLWNLNSPAVREYLVRYGVKTASFSPSGDLFIDNTIFPGQVLEDYSYVFSGARNGLAAHLSGITLEIRAEIVKRLDGKGLIMNALRFTNSDNEIFSDAVVDSGQFDGLMAENQFWRDGIAIGGSPRGATSVAWYRDLTQKMKSKGKKILFTASGSGFTRADPSKILPVWLWLHLVADDSTYFLLPGNGADGDSFDNQFLPFVFPLGYPLDQAPVQDGSVWSRRYERGTIVFDISSGRLDAIRFEENPPG